MEDFSLYVLDIAMNSVRARAASISISIVEDGEWLDFSIEDDGHGMTEKQLQMATDPFFTTRTTRQIGLGLPLFRMLAEMTGGSMQIASRYGFDSKEHGTRVSAHFGRTHPDFVPMGDMVSTVVTLIQGDPDICFRFEHRTERGSVMFSSRKIQQVLGCDIHLNEPEILLWIANDLRKQYSLLL